MYILKLTNGGYAIGKFGGIPDTFRTEHINILEFGDWYVASAQ